MKSSRLLLLLILINCCLTLRGQSTPTDALPQLKKEPKQGNLIDIHLDASRHQISAGSGFGITATITNTSDKPVFLTPCTAILYLPPEIVASNMNVTYRASISPGNFVGYMDNDPENQKNQLEKQKDQCNWLYEIKPGESLLLYWSYGFPESFDPRAVTSTAPMQLRILYKTQLLEELQFLFFLPGDYKLTTAVTCWTDPDKWQDTSFNSMESVTLPITAPETVILLGAAIGGLISSFIFGRLQPTKDNTDSSEKSSNKFKDLWRETKTIFRRYIRPALWSMIFSATVTILLARLAETQFIIRITVADLWGAITIGFVANYLGTGLIERMTTSLKKTRQKNQKRREQIAEN